MPRKRMIDPGFWSDAKMRKLQLPERLLYLALVSGADDFGKGCGEAAVIKGWAFPFDAEITVDNVAAWLARLKKVGVIYWWKDGGGMIFQLPTWQKHQRIDKPGASCHKNCPRGSVYVRAYAGMVPTHSLDRNLNLIKPCGKSDSKNGSDSHSDSQCGSKLDETRRDEEEVKIDGSKDEGKAGAVVVNNSVDNSGSDNPSGEISPVASRPVTSAKRLEDVLDRYGKEIQGRYDDVNSRAVFGKAVMKIDWSEAAYDAALRLFEDVKSPKVENRPAFLTGAVQKMQREHGKLRV